MTEPPREETEEEAPDLTGRIVLVSALLVVAIFFLVSTVRGWSRTRAAQATCDAALRSDFQGALTQSEGLVDGSSDGLMAAECRCVALLGLERTRECIDMLAPLWLAEPADGWVPIKNVGVLVTVGLRDEGRGKEAVDLARRLSRVHPFDRDVLTAEFAARSLNENEAALLEEIYSRTRSTPEADYFANWVAGRFERRGEAQRGLAILGNTPPKNRADLEGWVQTRGKLFANLGKVDETIETFETWKKLGGGRVEVAATLALLLSTSAIVDREAQISSLRSAINICESESESDAAKRWLPHLYGRLIGWQVNLAQYEEALSTYDRVIRRFDIPGISREMILRSQHAPPAMDCASCTKADLAVVFRSPLDGTLLVSPEPSESPGTAFVAHPVRAGAPLKLFRNPSPFPLRWVFRDTDRQVRGSGNRWPTREPAAVTLEPKLSVSLPTRPRSPRAPADGRRRLLNVIWDCGDWRLVQYLLARGELPFLQDVMTKSTYGTLQSTPAFTAAALDALMHPSKAPSPSLFGIIHQMGVELAGLSSIGRNPFQALGYVLPERENLLDVIGSGPVMTANMLFSHGLIQAGRNAETIGPNGKVGTLEMGASARLLNPDELVYFPGLERASANERGYVATMAAEMDIAVRVAREKAIDLLLLRIEPLDLATHSGYAKLLEETQDDGDVLLLQAYRYLDARLAELDGTLDEDDTLLLTSDHGIKNSMEHDPATLFFSIGPNAQGRIPPGQSWRTLPRAIGRFFGMDRPDWPEGVKL